MEYKGIFVDYCDMLKQINLRKMLKLKVKNFAGSFSRWVKKVMTIWKSYKTLKIYEKLGNLGKMGN